MSDRFRHFDEIARHLRPSAAEHCRCDLGAPWAIELPFQPGLRFHFVVSGECWLLLAGGERIHLRSGEFAALPHGHGHVIADPCDAVAKGLGELQPTPAGASSYRLRTGGPGRRAVVICGTATFDAPTARAVIDVMPPVLHVPDARLRDQALTSTLEQMSAEAAAPGPGSSTLLARLADIVIVRALRLWMDDNAADASGWIAALRDDRIGRALRAMHERPGDPWSVDALAGVASLSRATFSQRFAAVLGTSPARYLAQWRMRLAMDLLRQRRVTVAQIAEQLGYESDASFSRTFKRIVGESPAAVRRRAAEAID